MIDTILTEKIPSCFRSIYSSELTGYISKSELICPIPKEGYNEKNYRKHCPCRSGKPLVQKRVAAYARVSCGKDTMLHSLAAQIDYYRDYIMMNPEWRFAGVYADESKTGTKDNREQFQLLLTECRSGNIDMVITKSISRFARNTVTLLENRA